MIGAEQIHTAMEAFPQQLQHPPYPDSHPHTHHLPYSLPSLEWDLKPLQNVRFGHDGTASIPRLHPHPLPSSYTALRMRDWACSPLPIQTDHASNNESLLLDDDHFDDDFRDLEEIENLVSIKELSSLEHYITQTIRNIETLPSIESIPVKLERFSQDDHQNMSNQEQDDMFSDNDTITWSAFSPDRNDNEDSKIVLDERDNVSPKFNSNDVRIIWDHPNTAPSTTTTSISHCNIMPQPNTIKSNSDESTSNTTPNNDRKRKRSSFSDSNNTTNPRKESSPISNEASHCESNNANVTKPSNIQKQRPKFSKDENQPTTTSINFFKNPTTGRFHCPHPGCEITQTRKFNIKTHYYLHFGSASKCYECPICGRDFTRNYDTKRHMETVHSVGGDVVKGVNFLKRGVGGSTSGSGMGRGGGQLLEEEDDENGTGINLHGDVGNAIIGDNSRGTDGMNSVADHKVTKKVKLNGRFEVADKENDL
ncbi:hypothetical protein HDU76_004368 [Blyttiomyces sp. JEL0837]|nr:hypothetical protein HDU76_004368 [Blyttiomyces sp. JEL0837]